MPQRKMIAPRPKRASPPPPAPVSDADNPDRLLDIKQVADLIGCSTRKVMLMVQNDEFPQPRHVGVLARWRLRDYRTWVEKLYRHAS